MADTFQMLWDCRSCGTKKLLGLTHRSCPSCGSAQDPTARYFPPPGEEVAVENHPFVGVDWHCAACESPNSKAAGFCANCGNPREGNKEVRLVQDSGQAAPGPRRVVEAPPAPPARKRSVMGWVLGVALLILVGVVVSALWKKEVQVRVERHRWEREIEVERFAAVRQSAWCDSMPGDAYDVLRSREVRSQRQVPDGQTCRDVRKDNGDGTFRVEKHCEPKYRSEPVYADKCSFQVNRWGVVRTERAQGEGLQPAWPQVQLAGRGACLGCEREGGRREKLEVVLKDSARPDHTYTCALSPERWSALRDGEARPMKVRVVTGGAACDSLF